LKCIRPELLADERTRERFRRETKALARLQHPGLCTLYERGEAAGQPFLAMQFVDGESLEAQLARARAAGRVCWSAQGGDAAPGPDSGQAIARGVSDAVALVAQLARAVEVMHDVGIVHRDLKPANVMVTTAGPVLIDFGLARNLADAAASLTLSSDVVGTPAYMAPEQVEPRGRTADARTDVHALGAILYECLTMRPPLVGAGREDTYRRILREEPVELRQLQPAAGRDLAAVVHRALAREPHRRFVTAGDLAVDLERVLRGEPTRTRPPGPMRRLASDRRPSLRCRRWSRQRVSASPLPSCC
jgi:serine/threonine protein kinase